MIILPKDDIQKQEALKKCIVKFEKDRKYKEDEVNEILKSLDVEDHVLFRRELVNFGYFRKDSYKGLYWVRKYELTQEELEKIGINQKKIS